jgi:uncharacterized membrane protein (DUF2068 family)
MNADMQDDPENSGEFAAKRRTLRPIAVFEALKGVAALAAVLGLLSLVHRDVRHLAVELIGHFGLNPAAHSSSVLMHYADVLSMTELWPVMLLLGAYTAIRFAEAYGIWNDRAWGEWLGALSGGLYIPLEIRHFLHRPSVINGAVFVFNLAIVCILALRLRSRRACPGHPR